MKRFIIILFCLALGNALSAQSAVEKKEPAGGKNIFDGYEKVKWNDPVATVKNEVMGKIVYTDDKKVIITKDGDLEYMYGFFYKEASTQTAAPEVKEKIDKPAPAGPAGESRLFYVSIKFAYLIMEDVRKKMQERYGEPTGETLKNYQGAIIWESDKTLVVLWVDQYEKKPFSRKISYIGKDIIKELNDYQNQVFNATEIEILKRLKP